MSEKWIYIVRAYRFARHSAHNYTVGVKDKKAQAIKLAENHVIWRGGKYECEIEAYEIDKSDTMESPRKWSYRTGNPDKWED